MLRLIRSILVISPTIASAFVYCAPESSPDLRDGSEICHVSTSQKSLISQKPSMKQMLASKIQFPGHFTEEFPPGARELICDSLRKPLLPHERSEHIYPDWEKEGFVDISITEEILVGLCPGFSFDPSKNTVRKFCNGIRPRGAECEFRVYSVISGNICDDDDDDDEEMKEIYYGIVEALKGGEEPYLANSLVFELILYKLNPKAILPLFVEGLRSTLESEVPGQNHGALLRGCFDLSNEKSQVNWLVHHWLVPYFEDP